MHRRRESRSVRGSTRATPVALTHTHIECCVRPPHYPTLPRTTHPTNHPVAHTTPIHPDPSTRESGCCGFENNSITAMCRGPSLTCMQLHVSGSLPPRRGASAQAQRNPPQAPRNSPQAPRNPPQAPRNTPHAPRNHSSTKRESTPAQTGDSPLTVPLRAQH